MCHPPRCAPAAICHFRHVSQAPFTALGAASGSHPRANIRASMDFNASVSYSLSPPPPMAHPLHLRGQHDAIPNDILTQGDTMRNKQKGFSLIELLIVVAIILIIAAIAIPNLLRTKMAANEASAVG